MQVNFAALSESELLILHHLNTAQNLFGCMSEPAHSEDRRFREAIQTAKDQIAVQVAARSQPAFWRPQNAAGSMPEAMQAEPPQADEPKKTAPNRADDFVNLAMMLFEEGLSQQDEKVRESFFAVATRLGNLIPSAIRARKVW